MGLCAISKSGYEADDIIASVVKKYKDDELEIRVVTHDKDLYQLISDKVFIYSLAKKLFMTGNFCFEKYKVYPEQIRDFLAICGGKLIIYLALRELGKRELKGS